MNNFVIALAFVLAACAAPASDQEVASQLEAPAGKQAAPPASAPARNTYAETCSGIRAKFEAEPLSDALVKRLGPGGAIAGVQRTIVSMPNVGMGPKSKPNVLCRVIVNVNANGTVTDPLAQCTDPDYEAHAAATLQGTVFERGAYKNLIVPMEFCTND